MKPSLQTPWIELSNALSKSLYLKVGLLLLPVSLVWIVFGWAITQDGPAHLASAKIANEWLDGQNPVRSIYTLDLRPLPNWSGQAISMLALKRVPAIWANRLMNLAGLWLPPMAIVSLLRVVQAQRLNSGWGVALWVSLTAMNLVWSFGFTSFLLGLAMAWVVLGRVWSFGSGQVSGLRPWLGLAISWWVLFLCHLVAYGIAGLVCGSLILATPGWRLRKRFQIVAATATSLPLVWNYRRITGGSSLELIWEHFQWSQIFEVSNWVRHLGWIDPISVVSKRWLPIVEIESTWAILCQPLFWTILAIFVLLLDVGFKVWAGAKAGEQRGWFLGILILLIFGVLGPDSLGRDQGHYLPQRILIGAMSVASVVWPVIMAGKLRMATCFLAAAWLGQSVSLMELGRKSARLTFSISGTVDFISSGDRVLAFNDAKPWAYRSNPRLHLDSVVVMAAEAVTSWNLYEAAHAYFPLHFRQKPPGLDPRGLEAVSLKQSQEQVSERRLQIHSIVQAADGQVDVILVLADQGSELGQVVRDSDEIRTKWKLQRETQSWAIYRRR